MAPGKGFTVTTTGGGAQVLGVTLNAIVTVPAVTPHTRPVPLTVPLALLAAHTPGTDASVSCVQDPTQVLNVPVMGAGVGFIVRLAHNLHDETPGTTW